MINGPLRWSPLVTLVVATGFDSFAVAGGNPACGANATHDCFATGGPGCTDETCCNIVCALDSYCCNVAWDRICVSEANSNCRGGVSPCDDPNNHPCDRTGGPGCSDQGCCTTVCTVDSFCCLISWDSICVGEASVFCGPCFACVVCLPEYVQEAEPCGTNFNGGCDSNPPAFEKIALIQATCGTAWADAGQRDADWYQFTVTVDETIVNWSLYSTFPMMACIMNNDCGNLQVIAQGSGNDPVRAEAVLPAGTYIGFVADTSFNGNRCGSNNNEYVVLLYGTLPCLADATGEGTVNCADLLAVINDWGCQSQCTADLNGDGVVNMGDLLLVINNWGPCP